MSKKYVDIKSLFNCDTCRHKSDTGCEVFCDHGESYSPSLKKLEAGCIGISDDTLKNGVEVCLIEKISAEMRDNLCKAVITGIERIANEDAVLHKIELNEVFIAKALKNAVSVKPIVPEDCYPEQQYFCGVCGFGLTVTDKWKSKYCPDCGQAVNWDL